MRVSTAAQLGHGGRPFVRRSEGVYQFYSVNLYTIEGSYGDAAVNLNGSRGFLMAGVEF